jgi:hypothetical protein
MQSDYSEARAQALSYILLTVVLILGGYALWSHWSIANLPTEDASQLGAVVRSAPAILAVLTVPLMLWAISSGKLQLWYVVRKHWLVFALTAVGVCAIMGSAFWLLLEGTYQWGAQDNVLAAILMVTLTVLCIGFAGYAVAAWFNGRAGSR